MIMAERRGESDPLYAGADICLTKSYARIVETKKGMHGRKS
ncbi:MAG: hypothetical protein ABIH41_02630 [Nanoarchaeota archaeon]